MSLVKPFGPTTTVNVDCAMGSASTLLPSLLPHLAPYLNLNLLTVDPPSTSGGAVVNTRLNNRCGSEHVQNSRSTPKVYNGDPRNWSGMSASVDGDVDRIVFFSKGRGDGTEVKLYDGDRVNSLLTKWIVETTKGEMWGGGKDVRVGAVQTAYANSNSTKFLKNLGVECNVVKTGVR